MLYEKKTIPASTRSLVDIVSEMKSEVVALPFDLFAYQNGRDLNPFSYGRTFVMSDTAFGEFVQEVPLINTQSLKDSDGPLKYATYPADQHLYHASGTLFRQPTIFAENWRNLNLFFIRDMELEPNGEFSQQLMPGFIPMAQQWGQLKNDLLGKHVFPVVSVALIVKDQEEFNLVKGMVELTPIEKFNQAMPQFPLPAVSITATIFELVAAHRLIKKIKANI